MDLMNLAARLTLDMKDYEDGLGKADQSAQSFSKKFGGAIGKVGGAIKTVAKVGAVAIGAGATAVGFLTKQSVSAYAEYEQLAGGVKKLFGDASDDVMKFASEAYKTSGMSANQYMEQATGFAASLINSLGGNTKEAAKLADVAMQAMSDNVNTFGTDMGSVQYAFQGFAKQNYTMLDNLKLGYGGTKTEMERLIADAAAATDAQKKLGLSVDGTSMSFDNIVKAIQVIQYEQGIAGTTAKEAATTIEGAFNMTKAAWENLVAGFANPDADLDALMDNLIVSIVGDKEGEGLLNQLIPAIQRALEGVGKVIAKAGPVIGQNLPALVGSLVPSLLSAATSLVVSLVKALPGIIKVLVAQVPMIVNMLLAAFIELAGEFKSMGGDLMQQVFDGIKEKNPRIAEALSSIGESFQTIIGKMKDFWDEHGQEIYDKAVEIFNGIKNFIITAITFIVEGIDTFIQTALALWDEFGTDIMGYLSAVKDFYIAVFQVISETISNFITWAKEFWAEYGDEITAATQTAWEIISTIIHTVLQVITGIVKTLTAIIQGDWQTAFETVKGITQTIWNAISSIFSTVLGVIQKVVSSVLEAVRSKISSVFNSVKSTILSIWNNIKTIISNALNNVLTTVSNAMTNVRTTISNAWENAKKTVSDAVENIRNSIAEKFQAVYDKAHDIFEKVKDAITNPVESAKEFVKNLVDDIKGFFDFEWHLPDLKLPHIVVGSYINVPVLGTIPDPTTLRVEWYKKAYDNPWMFTKPTVIGFGDGNGGEMVYGHDNLMRDIKEAVGTQARTFAPVINVYTQEGQSNEDIAHKVMDILTFEYQRQGSVFA